MSTSIAWHWRARDLLTAATMPTLHQAIGESLGYKSHTSFINIFRKLTGLTPAQYQKIGKESV